jgi:CspA family cold shock protein
MTTGVVKFYNSDKGYGFVKPDDGGPDVFVHVSALEQGGISSLSEGARISFEAVMDQRKGKTNAQNVKLI